MARSSSHARMRKRPPVLPRQPARRRSAKPRQPTHPPRPNRQRRPRCAPTAGTQIEDRSTALTAQDCSIVDRPIWATVQADVWSVLQLTREIAGIVEQRSVFARTEATCPILDPARRSVPCERYPRQLARRAFPSACTRSPGADPAWALACLARPLSCALSGGRTCWGARPVRGGRSASADVGSEWTPDGES